MSHAIRYKNTEDIVTMAGESAADLDKSVIEKLAEIDNAGHLLVDVERYKLYRPGGSVTNIAHIYYRKKYEE